MSTRPIFVVAGVGNSSGTGGASAYVSSAMMHDYLRLRCPPIRRLFAKAGYNIALISRESANLHKFAAELKTGDTDVRHRPIPSLILY